METNQQIEQRIQELREKYVNALAQDREIIKRQARALQIILEKRKKN